MPEPIFPGAYRPPTGRTPPRWVKRKINLRAHQLAAQAYIKAVEAMVGEYQERQLDVRLIPYWEPELKE
jgi:hypothetical protein